ncbi:hypothetical protein F5148DRAFT_1284310 [Russula earlei]|uniref:Uncharacterized protein n=1 Tax=Russula earlei TaxID=71964 RepID=A0ACC0UAN8_9AGAM|nr:hypothetical protein F5148DRAFT_1284310 [Russula earlei]
MDPPFLAFSSEILIEILSHLPQRDIVACKLTCRKLNDVIAHSFLLQYIAQASLAGVHDSLLPGRSTIDRSNALQGLEDAWRDLSIRQRTAKVTRVLALRGDSDDPRQPPGYSYIDLREPTAFTNTLWRKVDVPWRGRHCMFAFAANENDLAVVVTCARDEEISRAEVHCLDFLDGEPHPQAENPDLVIDFPAPTSPHHMQVQLTGDHIIVSCNGSPDDERQVDVLFLLRETPPPAMTFAVGFTMISETLLAFVHMAKNAIFLYGFDGALGRVTFVRALELPPLCDGGRLNYAHCLSEQNPVFSRHHHRHPTTSRTRRRPPPRFPFRYNPADGVACFVLGVSLEDIPGASMTVALVVHRRALLALASASTSTDAGARGTDEQPVSWDSWGPQAARCLEVPYWRRCGGPVGQRWGVLAHDELVLHDFNPHNVRRASARQQQQHLAPAPAPGTSTSTSGARGVPTRRENEAVSENPNRTRVVTAPTVLTAGLCFRGDVMTRLPYVETRAACTPRWESVLIDGERLLGLYFKEDDADAHEVDIDVYLMGTSTAGATSAAPQ